MRLNDSGQLAQQIRAKALALGYEKCGIIAVTELTGYAQKLAARISRFPDTKDRFDKFYGFAKPTEIYPWAKSVVVCVRPYNEYKIPAHLQGVIAKYYLLDSRTDKASSEYQDSILFEQYLHEQGIYTATERKFGLTALRWAAVKAGLGIIRKNNFFYTQSGSWVHLEAWLIDQELELTEVSTLADCAANCQLCIQACPTQALCAPYEMSRSACVSCITTWDGRDMPNDPYREQLGTWVYGCDACQDICPHNQNKWVANTDFPGLKELATKLTLEQIIEMDYDYLENIIQPKFWYIPKQDVWKWKVNALNAMYNNWADKYQKYLTIASCDEHAKVRAMANFIGEQTASI